jgi:hypothetical protein
MHGCNYSPNPLQHIITSVPLTLPCHKFHIKAKWRGGFTNGYLLAVWHRGYFQVPELPSDYSYQLGSKARIDCE